MHVQNVEELQLIEVLPDILETSLSMLVKTEPGSEEPYALHPQAGEVVHAALDCWLAAEVTPQALMEQLATAENAVVLLQNKRGSPRCAANLSMILKSHDATNQIVESHRKALEGARKAAQATVGSRQPM